MRRGEAGKEGGEVETDLAMGAGSPARAAGKGWGVG